MRFRLVRVPFLLQQTNILKCIISHDGAAALLGGGCPAEPAETGVTVGGVTQGADPLQPPAPQQTGTLVTECLEGIAAMVAAHPTGTWMGRWRLGDAVSGEFMVYLKSKRYGTSFPYSY